MVSLVLFGCGVAKKYQSLIAKCYIGMSISEFKDVSKDYKRVKLLELSPRRTVYKAYYTGYDYKFLYFDSTGKLFQMDEGVRQPDINMQINKNINRN